MNTYYTIEEKYLKAVEKVSYGRTPKGLRLLKEIIEDDPLYARAHHQLVNYIITSWTIIKLPVIILKPVWNWNRRTPITTSIIWTWWFS